MIPAQQKDLGALKVDDVVPETSGAKRRQRRVRTTKIPDDLRQDPAKLLDYIFETLCSLRIMAKSSDQTFLTYLIEMAALEAEAAVDGVNAGTAEEKPSKK